MDDGGFGMVFDFQRNCWLKALRSRWKLQVSPEICRTRQDQNLVRIFGTSFQVGFDLGFPVHAVLAGSCIRVMFLLTGWALQMGTPLWAVTHHTWQHTVSCRKCKLRAWNLPVSALSIPFYDQCYPGSVPVIHGKCVINIFSDCARTFSELSHLCMVWGSSQIITWC